MKICEELTKSIEFLFLRSYIRILLKDFLLKQNDLD